jgi:hypothetical protein
MRKVFHFSFVLFIVLFLGHISIVFSQEKQNEVKTYTIEIYAVDDIPVRLNSLKIEERELDSEFRFSKGTYEYTVTNLTNIKIRQIQLVKFVFNQNGKRISTDINNLMVDLEPFATKEISELIVTNDEPINPEYRTIIAINSVLNFYEVWDLSIREVERAVTAFVKGKYIEPLKVRHTKLLSP